MGEGSLRVKQHGKQQMQIKAQRKSLSGAILGDARVSIASRGRRFCEGQTGEVKTIWGPRRGGAMVTKQSIVGIHMYVAPGSSEDAGVPPQHEALGRPKKICLVVNWRQRQQKGNRPVSR